MFERWELLYSPSEKDKNRWRLKMNISEESLESVFAKIGVNTGRPFSTADTDYNWGVYLYNITSDERRSIVKSLKEDCAEGRIVVEGMELSVDEELESAGQPAQEMVPEQVRPVETASETQSPDNNLYRSSPAPAGQSPDNPPVADGKPVLKL